MLLFYNTKGRLYLKNLQLAKNFYNLLLYICYRNTKFLFSRCWKLVWSDVDCMQTKIPCVDDGKKM